MSVQILLRKVVPLFTGGRVNVHALWSGQTLWLSLQAVGGGAGEGTDTFTALTAIYHTCRITTQLNISDDQQQRPHDETNALKCSTKTVFKLRMNGQLFHNVNIYLYTTVWHKETSRIDCNIEKKLKKN